MTFGNRLKKIREEKGLTQKELADQLHVTFQTVSKWEKDVNEPCFSTLKDIAKTLNCSIGYLFGERNDNNAIELLYSGQLKIKSLDDLIDETLEGTAHISNEMVKQYCNDVASIIKSGVSIYSGGSFVHKIIDDKMAKHFEYEDAYRYFVGLQLTKIIEQCEQDNNVKIITDRDALMIILTSWASMRSERSYKKVAGANKNFALVDQNKLKTTLVEAIKRRDECIRITNQYVLGY